MDYDCIILTCTSKHQYSNFSCDQSLVKFYLFVCISLLTEMPRVWSSTCWWLTWPSDTDACAMARMTSRTIGGSRTWTGSSWDRSVFQCLSFPRLAVRATPQTSQSILTRTKSPPRYHAAMIPSSIGEQRRQHEMVGRGARARESNGI